MEPKLKVKYVPIDSLVPYAHNAKEHPDWQIDQIAESIKQFGNCDPIAVWHNPKGEAEIVEGHGRLMALKKLGATEVPTIELDHLDDDARRAYTHVHNQTTLTSGFDWDALNADLSNISGFDWAAFGFEKRDWFTDRERWDTARKGYEEYDAFLDKFEAKHTTDDCYTPDNIYEAVADWVANEYGVNRADMVRPFYPGGDYQNEEYPDGCCVVDNPPFSILAEIIRFYMEKGVRFFIFAPALTLFSSSSSCTAIPCNVPIVYENGANVSTSFVTNLDDVRIRTAPTLYAAVDAANDANLEAMHADLPKYDYPNEVLTASKGGYLSKYGQNLRVAFEDCVNVSALDAQREQGKAIYGKGYLLSKKAAAEKAAAEKAAAEKAAAEKAAAEKAAAEKAAAEKAAATRWKLSDREWEIIRSLGKEAHDER